MSKIKKIKIFGLYGVRDYSIDMTSKKLIIVGENGSGKTTIFKILYYTLICDWDSLRTFSFEKIELILKGNKKIIIEHELLQNVFSINDVERVGYYIDGRPRHRRLHYESLISDLIRVKKESMKSEPKDVNTSIPYRYVQEIVDNPIVNELFDITQKIEEAFEDTILYMPTYRRIEEQLKNIFPYVDDDEWEKSRKRTGSLKSVELVEFGMDDVDKAVKKYQEHLKEFSQEHQNKLTLGYFSEIVDEMYEQVDIKEIMNLEEQQINKILNRIDSKILSDNQKRAIITILSKVSKTQKQPTKVKEKIICHYFLKLISFDREISAEEANLLKFIDICNKYLVNNKLVYDSKTFKCNIYNKTEGDKFDSEEIHFQNLSSGEKQIVSIFSHLNLSNNNSGVFVFIDEPELSLSVEWQRMFLTDILDSNKCVGLIATTHSPFVFENYLEKHVYGINEFCTRG